MLDSMSKKTLVLGRVASKMTLPVRPSFSSSRVLVVGDVMLDRYWHGSATRISPEAPVPVVHVRQVEDRPGGAANVACNVRAFGSAVALAGIVGRDADGASLAALLTTRGIEPLLLQSSAVTTIVKLRVMSQHQQLIRLDFEHELAGEFDAFCAGIDGALAHSDAVVLSDYAKGTLVDPQRIIERARERGVPVVVDPKHADFSRYAGATVLTPNLREFEAAVGQCVDEDTLVRAARRQCELHGFEAILVTRGEHGMTLVPRADEPCHLPARARDVFDVTGAGDTVCAMLGAGLAAGCDLRQATVYANAAAGLVVGRLGTATVTFDEIEAALEPRTVAPGGAVDEERLVEEIAAARRRGEVIVFTNGCFDLLHAGHVASLVQARSLGDRLVVAVNDDASVRRLKGPRRPVTPLAGRMAVLAALAVVDWVVPFAEDTPERLINRILPDVLCKGGDYRIEDIAGSGAVRAAGGSVVLLDLVPGFSTTRTVELLLSAGAGSATS